MRRATPISDVLPVQVHPVRRFFGIPLVRWGKNAKMRSSLTIRLGVIHEYP